MLFLLLRRRAATSTLVTTRNVRCYVTSCRVFVSTTKTWGARRPSRVSANCTRSTRSVNTWRPSCRALSRQTALLPTTPIATPTGCTWKAPPRWFLTGR